MNVIDIERFDALRDRLRKWSGELLSKEEAENAVATLPEHGRRFRFILRVVIAVISALSGGLLFAFFYAIDFPLKELSAALVCIAASEFVRHRLGWRHTGAEEGWMLAGAWLLVFALPDAALHGDVTLLLLGVASAGAGLRVRAPLWLGVATLFFCGWLGEIWLSDELVIAISLSAAIATALMRGRAFRSSLIELSLVWVQLAFVVGAVAHAPDQQFHVTAMLLVGAAVLVATGLALRDTVTLWSAVPLLIASGYEIGRILPLPVEWRFLFSGIALIALTVVAERALHRPVRGWTSRRFESAEGLLELAATVAITPAREPATGRGDGGDFGGGGATERY